MYQQLIKEFVQQEQLPRSYLTDATQCFVPLVHEIDEAIGKPHTTPFFVGINGAQGTGKSTLAKLLSTLLESKGYRVANLSIDDFYYSKSTRQRLAQEVHPLLLSRGVPGTHDVELALLLLEQLATAGSEQRVRLPSFDKARDDCRPIEDFETVPGPVDVVILEGWFVGAKEQTEDELAPAINTLESDEDGDGSWRRYVNQQLASAYQPLFERMDLLLMLQAPGFEQIFEWRYLQEEKLRARATKNADGLMDREGIERFIQHFERLTRHCLKTLPASADRVFRLDADHRIYPHSN